MTVLRLVNRLLTARGYYVHSIEDPELALDYLRQDPAKLVIVDLDMPKKGGLSLLREIKAFDGIIQVIVMTGLASVNTIVKATSMGAEESIFKPIGDLQDLTA